MTMQSPIIDSQVHAYERDHPARPWQGWLHGPPEVTGDDMVAAMDATGVDGALLVSPWTMYRFDASYALEVYALHPERFGLIKPFNPVVQDVANEMADWAARPGVVGARIMLQKQMTMDSHGSGLNQILSAGARQGLPINILCWGTLPLLSELAKKNPHTQIVVDHVGLNQPFEPPVPPEPFANLADVIALARYDNVAIKISGACTLSHQPFPYEDIWEPLSQIFEAFGFDRCLWGTDWTRAVELLTYEQGVEAFRLTDQLSDSERDMLMGGSVAGIYDWVPGI
ncbi:MAG TPA: amidohydrolase family protein [Pseudomonadales bacterium]|jgi:predicted TIM-barrel fold metal-dependent hydrolase|nr:amidohydrolase family protein [Pseudomonadales bacterium]MDP7316494.1 amidohydrolase family protein [Pseudomonadales bacterium]HJL61460.1 amidohydrolase family protein [Pseudomonadales bacterium]HJP50447.1 amidohydrolase family protein [Pseudomonadales bacterium]